MAKKKGKMNRIYNALMNYPNLYNNKMDLLRATLYYNTLSKDKGEIDKLYDTLPYKEALTDIDKSNIRHPYANAQYIRKGYTEDFVRDLGKFKEDVDQIENKPMWDTQGDLVNNEYGIKLGKQYPTAPNIILFDEILQHFGLPIPARNNTLYGYSSFTEGVDRKLPD